MNIEVNEIFYGIEGETTASGFTAIFIRLKGCNLNCKYCDTREAKVNGSVMGIKTIVEAVQSLGPSHHITVTGGEPLMQENTLQLLKELVKLDYSIQVETNGSIPLQDIPKEVRKIVDIKTPSSGENNSFHLENISFLNNHDEIKFVIADKEDYDFSREFIKKYLINRGVCLNVSPAYSTIPLQDIADLIIADNLPVRLNLQLHKVIWGKGSEKKREIVLDSSNRINYI